MFKCETCGREFDGSQALGSHRRYGHALLPALKTQDSRLKTQDSRLLATKLKSQESRVKSQGSRVLALSEAEQVALREWSRTSKPVSKVSLGRLFAALAIGGFVAWLVYTALQNWEPGQAAKKISPYKLIGGLITGLG